VAAAAEDLGVTVVYASVPYFSPITADVTITKIDCDNGKYLYEPGLGEPGLTGCGAPLRMTA
jgi:hypothetical protein